MPYLDLYTIHLVSKAYFILGLLIRCSDKQTNVLLDINCVTVTSASTITKLDWNQPSVSRGRSRRILFDLIPRVGNMRS